MFFFWDHSRWKPHGFQIVLANRKHPEAMVALEQLKTFSRSKSRSNLPPVPPMVASEVLEIVDEKGRVFFFPKCGSVSSKVYFPGQNHEFCLFVNSCVFCSGKSAS